MAHTPELLLPRRVLIVDDDELTREALSAQLRAADFEVAVAVDGEEALTIIGRQWFPVVVTDRAMPIMDGIQFVSRFRCTSIAPTYVIMLTAINDAHDYELGYCAGVDLYIVKSQDGELVARVAAAFAAVRRRQAQSAQPDHGPITVDLESGAHSARHLVGRLHAEMSRATRAAQVLQVVSVCIEARAQTQLNKAAGDALFGAVQTAVRAKLDWIARLPAPRHASRLAVVMPDSGPQAFAAFEQGVRNAFVSATNNAAMRDSQVTFGVASLSEAGERPTALGLLAEAERKRRGAIGRTAPVATVNNLQDGEAA